VFGAPGKDTTTTDGFSAELGTERPGQVQTVSMDMGPAFAAYVGANAPAATIAIDPFHAVNSSARWTSNAAKPGTSSGNPGTRRRPASSKAPAGRF